MCSGEVYQSLFTPFRYTQTGLIAIPVSSHQSRPHGNQPLRVPPSAAASVPKFVASLGARPPTPATPTPDADAPSLNSMYPPFCFACTAGKPVACLDCGAISLVNSYEGLMLAAPRLAARAPFSNSNCHLSCSACISRKLSDQIPRSSSVFYPNSPSYAHF